MMSQQGQLGGIPFFEFLFSDVLTAFPLLQLLWVRFTVIDSNAKHLSLNFSLLLH